MYVLSDKNLGNGDLGGGEIGDFKIAATLFQDSTSTVCWFLMKTTGMRKDVSVK